MVQRLPFPVQDRHAVGPAVGYGFGGWAIFAGAALYLLSRHVSVFSAATAALLVSPYGFHYDMPVASLGFLLALYLEKSPLRTLAFAAALMLPVVVRFGAWIAPPILLLALWAQTMGRDLEAISSEGETAPAMLVPNAFSMPTGPTPLCCMIWTN